MRIIFVRHCEPDYKLDSLTEKGFREAKLLAKRVATWDNITDYYVSPLGRAQATCHASLDPINKSAETLPWLREFCVPIVDPVYGKKGIPWDLMPEYWTNIPELYDKDKWLNADIYKDANMQEEINKVYTGLDTLLLKYGYKREGNIYTTEKEKDDTTIVLFCHLGVSYVCLSHLLGIAPSVLWQSIFVAPSSVTIVATEERIPHKAAFRIQVMGDTKHLAAEGEPISKSGFFTEVFQN